MPFPEFRRLEIIFGSSAAHGDAARSVNQRISQLQARASGITSDSTQGYDEGPMSTSELSPANNLNLDGSNCSPLAPSPSPYLSRSHHKKDSIARAIDGLVGYLEKSTQDRVDRRLAPQQRLAEQSGGSNLQQAMMLYQDVHAEQASQNEALAAFKVFRNDVNAQIFTSIKDKSLRESWLHEQIDEMNNH